MNRHRYPDDPLNAECAECGKAIWVREGIYTVYHGKLNTSIGGEVESIVDMKRGNLCVDCWEKGETE